MRRRRGTPRREVGCILRQARKGVALAGAVKGPQTINEGQYELHRVDE